AEISGAERARQRVEDITREPEVGELYHGKVTSIKPFGCFVEIIPGQEGLVHVSELSSGYVASVRDVVREGDMVWVKVLAVDDNDRVRLSKKAADEEREGREAAPAGSARG
ncbi:MAG: S1 RNA-binding domain-containing protein, partial [Planctomycetes bacterium]|nr:S1 RNA-binding domain-containing protein [Planctomycetota bacterium]